MLTLLALAAVAATPADAPALPERDGTLTVAAQPWPFRPGPRTVEVGIFYPGGRLDRVGPRTGLFLTLHNWGGSKAIGTADPRTLADRYDAVAITVDYLQSGDSAAANIPEPYDYGYLQALDALRGLRAVWSGLERAGRPFAKRRVYATGGSGGGNVTLMANKLAPRTFAAAVEVCGMARLTDTIAFGGPGAKLTARYRREPGHPNHLTPDAQELRHLGHPGHLAAMKAAGNACQMFVVHGVDDDICPFVDAKEMAAAMKGAGLTVEPVFVDKAKIDGKVYTSTGHAVGNRTLIVSAVADMLLKPDAPTAAVRPGPSDFERRDEVVYPTANGRWVISYAAGAPWGWFEPAAPTYPDHLDLSYTLDAAGQKTPIKTPADWARRAGHIRAHFERVAGPLPGAERRVPLDVKVTEEVKVGDLVRRKLTFASEPGVRVPAYLFLPPGAGRKPAVLCLQQTTKHGKAEPAGLAGGANLHYALELARRGYVTLAPDFPGFGEYDYDFSPRLGYVSGTMKAVWDNVRATDLLQTLPDVDGDRIGVVGHSLGGHMAIFTAVFEPRLKAVASSCGFCRFGKDDVPSWTGPRYMPRIAKDFGNDAARVPFDFPELIAALAPRPFFAAAATRDSDFDIGGVKDCLTAARPVYALFGKADSLGEYYPDAPHDFPPDARERVYAFFDKSLRTAAK
jgi:dienelactone hydrolase